ncbi:MAG: hypothetical protein KGL39_20425 [Patescibacteria group bacterium]|nr:hypothetical protein [Patescibacteria group bacterium]
MAEVHLQFTQEDRDLLLRMDAKLEGFLEAQGRHSRRLNSHHKRISRLEKLRDEGRGMARAVKWIWVALGAIGGALGFHLRQHQ